MAFLQNIKGLLVRPARLRFPSATWLPPKVALSLGRRNHFTSEGLPV